MSAPTEQPPEAAHSSAHSNGSILIVDDDDCFRELAKILLGGKGFELHEAPDGFEALKQLSNTPTDLLITDLFMPEQDGIETIIKVQKLYPKLKILAVSGAAGSEPYLRTARMLGAGAVLDKESVQECLASTVLTLLAHS